MLKETPSTPIDGLRPVMLACFGRGGSNIVFGALGGSPDAVRMEREWHQAVFADANTAKRALRWLSRRGIGHALGTGNGPVGSALRHIMRARVAADLRPASAWTGRPPARVVMKVMDHNIIRVPWIERAFGPGQVICLTRAPVPQCESLIRSGLSVDAACRWYVDVARAMAALAPRAHMLRFEDLLKDPVTALDDAFMAVGLTPCPDYEVKDKSFGAARGQSTDVTDAARRRLSADGLRAFVQPDVNARAIKRLPRSDRATIARATKDAARALGYDAHA